MNAKADKHLLVALEMANGFSDAALKKKQAEEVKKALDEGANPNFYLPMNKEQPEYKNVLYDTVHGGTPEVIELLLQYGADPNAMYWFKYSGSPEKLISSALHYATQRRTGGVAIVRALLLAGAKVDMKDHKGITPMDLAKKADIKKLLSLAKAGKLKAHTRVAPAKRSLVPKQLADFFARKALRYKGQSIPNFIAEGGKTIVKFLKKPSESVFRDRDVDPLTCPHYHVLAELDEEEHFLVVDGRTPALPVLRWESETGEFEAVNTSLEAFLKRLKS